MRSGHRLGMAPRLRDLIADELRAALRARDRRRIAVLRTAAAAIANAEAVPPSPDVRATEVDRRDLTEADERRIVEAERDEALAGATELAGLGADDRAAELRAQAAVLDDLLARTAGVV